MVLGWPGGPVPFLKIAFPPKSTISLGGETPDRSVHPSWELLGNVAYNIHRLVPAERSRHTHALAAIPRHGRKSRSASKVRENQRLEALREREASIRFVSETMRVRRETL